MTATRKNITKRADRFVGSEKGIVVHRAAGKKRIPGLSKQTTRPAARRGVEKLGLGTLRRDRHLTQVELAERIGIGQDEVSRIERRRDLKLSTVLRYLHGLEAADVELSVTYPDGTHATLPLAN